MTVTPEPPAYGGCPWPVDTACFTSEWDSFSPEVQQRAIALASSTLQRLTGNRVGNCSVTVRPCKAACAKNGPMRLYYGYGAFNPYINSLGQWVNGCGHSASGCSCIQLCEVRLPRPVGRVDEVMLDGSVVDPANYFVSDNKLIWAGDGCPWPACQDLSKPDTEVGTFSVTYLNAYPVDSLGAYAAGTLAMEYAKACGGGRCRLPAGVTTVVRQGVTMEIASGAFPDGLTGIREVDAYLALWNPMGLQRQGAVWSPDVHRPQVH